ncbi:MAG: hypothetical protein HY589_02320 [Candidatus Omnitrophica bacterium]|nr:hypothetical protein [Candidatus Omnitrophota bacterium]
MSRRILEQGWDEDWVKEEPLEWVESVKKVFDEYNIEKLLDKDQLELRSEWGEAPLAILGLCKDARRIDVADKGNKMRALDLLMRLKDLLKAVIHIGDAKFYDTDDYGNKQARAILRIKNPKELLQMASISQIGKRRKQPGTASKNDFSPRASEQRTQQALQSSILRSLAAGERRGRLGTMGALLVREVNEPEAYPYRNYCVVADAVFSLLDQDEDTAAIAVPDPSHKEYGAVVRQLKGNITEATLGLPGVAQLLENIWGTFLKVPVLKLTQVFCVPAHTRTGEALRRWRRGNHRVPDLAVLLRQSGQSLLICGSPDFAAAAGRISLCMPA